MARGMNHREEVSQFLVELDRLNQPPLLPGRLKALRTNAEGKPGRTGVAFQTFADFSYDWETWRGPEGDYIYVSPSCERITGYPQEAFYADPWLTKKIAHPDDRGRIGDHFKKGSRQEGQCRLDFRIITSKGEERWISHCCQPVYGSSSAWLGRRSTNRDITERVKAEQALRESEAKFRALAESAPAAIFIVQGERFVYVNPAFEEITGFRREEPFPRHLRDLIPPKLQPTRGNPDSGRRKSQTPPQRHETKIVTKDGRVRWADVTATLIHCGDKSRVLGIAYDNTQRRQAQNALLARERELAVQTQHLQEMNATLKVLLKQREEDRRELEETILSHVKRLILPYLARLKRAGLETRQAAYVETIENHLKDIVSPFMRSLSTRYFDLTPMEIQVATLVKEGRTTKDIAALLNRSPHAIDFHRNNIRKKMGITCKAANLRSHLLTLS